MDGIDEIESLRAEATTIFEELIADMSDTRRMDVHRWAMTLEQRYDKDFINRLKLSDINLSDLIDALAMVTTPNESGGWLYDRDDFQEWAYSIPRCKEQNSSR